MSIRVCVSEIDAKTKWCPFVRLYVTGIDRAHDIGTHNRIVLQKENDAIANPADSRCIGSNCMAWRWVRTHINNPDDPKADLIESTDTHGYCGLAGAPLP